MKTITIIISGIDDTFTLPIKEGNKLHVIAPPPERLSATLSSLGVDIVSASNGNMSDVFFKVSIEATKRSYCSS